MTQGRTRRVNHSLDSTIHNRPKVHEPVVASQSRDRMNQDSSTGGLTVRTVTPQELLGALTKLELKHAPNTLYVAGRLKLPLLHPRVAIVGTRNPSDEGRLIASSIAASLA